MLSTLKVDPRIRAKHEELISKPDWIVVTDFENEHVGAVLTAMEAAVDCGQGIIPIHVHSFGGHGYGLLALLEAIKAAPVPVATLVSSFAFSAGGYLLAAGTKGYRFAAPNARIMVHDVNCGTGYGKLHDGNALMAESTWMNEYLLKNLARQCGKDDEYFERLVHEFKHADVIFGAEDALRHGMVDHIRVPTLETTIEVKTRLRNQ